MKPLNKLLSLTHYNIKNLILHGNKKKSHLENGSIYMAVWDYWRAYDKAELAAAHCTTEL
ncbi:hypothetical protein E2C01_002078 [Portunus trituberculatus]|uniref:Uncharacterized protein n=1 Tax=Portunus trituberculatus TaxID=210409 RepID=A0A5B7CJL2_PORTR|nr:hypothetical protein [Portunus trituberculatus]